MTFKIPARLARGAVFVGIIAAMAAGSVSSFAGGVNVREIKTPAERCASQSANYQRYQLCLVNAEQKYLEALARRLNNDLAQCGQRGNGEDSNKAIECRCQLDPSRTECSASKS